MQYVINARIVLYPPLKLVCFLFLLQHYLGVFILETPQIHLKFQIQRQAFICHLF